MPKFLIDWIEARRHMSQDAKYGSEIEGVNTMPLICKPNWGGRANFITGVIPLRPELITVG